MIDLPPTSGMWMMSVRYFARYGEWPMSPMLVLRGQPIPHQLAQDAKMARALYLNAPEADYEPAP